MTKRQRGGGAGLPAAFFFFSAEKRNKILKFRKRSDFRGFQSPKVRKTKGKLARVIDWVFIV
jgi:hypothetical protein